METVPKRDQDSTDMTKSLTYIIDKIEAGTLDVSAIVVLGGLDGGRFDHVMGNVNSTLMMSARFPHIYLAGKESWSCALLAVM